MNAATRREHDSLGEGEIPATAYYGIQTRRAAENFRFSGLTIAHYRPLVVAFAQIKKAAALANRDLRLLDPRTTRAIARACDEIIAGQFDAEFIVDPIQGGAGTSTNMNFNEVIANRALEHLGRPRGDYAAVHPNNHVNLSQSTNDVYPSALKLALRSMIRELASALRQLADCCGAKGIEFRDVLKMGRTQLQDAVPMTLGHTFAAFRCTLLEEIERLDDVSTLLLELNLGGTAIGTAINASPRYRRRLLRHLVRLTGEPYCSALDLVEATQDTGVFVMVSGVLKRTASKLTKLCNDLRLLSSGPRAGLNEINLPPMQPGSSIMPGKVNPVIPEVVNEISFIVIGNDVTVTLAASAGQLELNAFEPVIAAKLFESLDLLTRGAHTLRGKCIAGITANAAECRRHVDRSIGLVTALVPLLGYERSAQLANEALRTGRSLHEVVLARRWLSRDALQRALDPRNMIPSPPPPARKSRRRRPAARD